MAKRKSSPDRNFRVAVTARFLVQVQAGEFKYMAKHSFEPPINNVL